MIKFDKKLKPGLTLLEKIEVVVQRSLIDFGFSSSQRTLSLLTGCFASNTWVYSAESKAVSKF